MAISPFDEFCEYLRADASARGVASFADTLRRAGFPLESALIEHAEWTAAPQGDAWWSGRRTFVGRRAPLDAKPGELWLDAVELMPMLRVELPAQGSARSARPGWMAVRPVARWQFRAFAAIAPLVARAVQLRPATIPLDPNRLACGDDAAPMTRITFGEATLYAWYFGKSITGTHAWNAAEAALGDATATLWHPDTHEFVGYGTQEDERTRTGAATCHLDPYDGEGMVVNEMFQHADTGFRTAGDGELVIDAHGNLPTFEPIALARKFPR